MRNVAGFALICLALSAGVAFATTSPFAVPATTGYQIETKPMIVGTVVSMNDQELVVNTDDGRQVALMMDSRTMKPVDLAPGMMMRAEFRLLDNGSQYAQRIVPLRGQSELESHMAHRHIESRTTADVAMATTTDEYGEPVEDETYQTAAHTTEDADAQVAQTTEAEAPTTETTTETDMSTQTTDESEETLPQTASGQPLLTLFGLLAVGAAAAIWGFRRSRPA